MADVIDESACTYERLKGKLLERIGLSRRDLEIKMFNDLEEDCRGMDRKARYKHIKVLIDRVLMMAKDKYEIALFVAKGLYRVELPISEQGKQKTKQKIIQQPRAAGNNWKKTIQHRTVSNLPMA